jgi:hypothetical protein
LDRCQDVFKEIEGIIHGLRKNGGKAREAWVDLVALVKWTFKRSHVQVLGRLWSHAKLHFILC